MNFLGNSYLVNQIRYHIERRCEKVGLSQNDIGHYEVFLIQIIGDTEIVPHGENRDLYVWGCASRRKALGIYNRLKARHG